MLNGGNVWMRESKINNRHAPTRDVTLGLSRKIVQEEYFKDRSVVLDGCSCSLSGGM